jgi:hypothetical protein
MSSFRVWGSSATNHSSNISSEIDKNKVLNWVSPDAGSGHANARDKLQEDIKDAAGTWLLKETKYLA